MKHCKLIAGSQCSPGRANAWQRTLAAASFTLRLGMDMYQRRFLQVNGHKHQQHLHKELI